MSRYARFAAATLKAKPYEITGEQAAHLSLTDPALRQVYLRYIGPR